MSTWKFVSLAAVFLLHGAGTAGASESLSYQCNLGNQFVFIRTVPEEGRAIYEELGREVQLSPDGRGGYANSQAGIAFDNNAADPRLWRGDRRHRCEVNVAGATKAAGMSRGNESRLNVQGQSLGGRLRGGPGTHFGQVGSLPEGTFVTILTNTGVRHDGYDWFEVVADSGLRGYQWGGIMCSNGQLLQGIFEQCRGGRPAVPVQAENGTGWMAFAVAPSGRFGHGAAPSRQGAEQTALNYCGEAGCRVEDVTTARCHALAKVPGATWFGAAPTERMAQDYALGFCRNAGARGCRIEYTYCQ